MGALVPGSTYAEGLVDWAMYTNPTNAVLSASLPNFGDVAWDDEVSVDNLKNYAAIRISGEIATDYAGCEIKSIKPVSGIFEDDPSGQTIKVSLAYSLDGESIFSKEYHPVGSVMDWNTYEITWNKDIIEIDTESPIVFEAGKEMYVILEYVETSDQNYEYVIDWDFTGETVVPEGSYYSAFEGTAYINGVEKTFTKEWTDVSQDIMCGALCVALTISGVEGGEENTVELLSLDMPERVIPGESFDITAKIHNLGGNNVNSITAVCDVNGMAIEKIFELDPLVYDYSTEITFTGITWDDDCILPVTVTLTEVNGVDNGALLSKRTQSGIIKCLTDGYFPNVVIEEGTGTWCGWCIRGIVAMGTMHDLYPDGSFIGMAVHNDDEMYPAYAQPIFNLFDKWVGGYPCMVVNRLAGYDVSVGGMINQYENVRSSITYGKINVTGYIDGDEAVVNSTSVFSLNDSKGDYRVGYAILENNVGPYIQKNSYSGGAAGEMGGFEDLDKYVELTYDDVVRSYYGCDGLPESLPAEIKKGEEYTHECRIPLTNVDNKDEVSVVALLIDANTGAILNADKAKKLATGIQTIEASASGKVEVEGRVLTLRETELPVALFALDGRRVAELKPEVSVSVEPGVYVAKIGSKSIKLIVK